MVKGVQCGENQLGAIYLAATPIGNPADSTRRLEEAIETCDIVAAEDTRRFRSLQARLGATGETKIVALHDHNEKEQSKWLVEQAEKGKQILVVSDAGTPTVSDPGYQLVSQAAKAGVKVVPLPGPSAALAALTVSGLPTDRFVFEGFLPRKNTRAHILQLAAEPRTLILFESPRRTEQTLSALAAHFGADRPAAVCRELTKTHEEVVRGTLGELVQNFLQREILGEITIVVGGAPQNRCGVDLKEIGQKVVDTSKCEGLRLKDAAALVAKREGIRKNQAMEAALKYRDLSQDRV